MQEERTLPEGTPFMSLDEACDFCRHTDRRKFQRLTNDGTIPGYKVLGRWVYVREELQRFMTATPNAYPRKG